LFFAVTIWSVLLCHPERVFCAKDLCISPSVPHCKPGT
jgi:hypothetical protein